MLGNNFSYCEDSFPRIAPSPTTILPQNNSEQHSSVPEVSLIFTNNNAFNNNQASKTKPPIPTSKQFTSTYPMNSTGPIPPKSSVPELSIILQNNDTGNILYSSNGNASPKLNATNQIKSNGQCSLPIRTFSMFKKEFSKKIESTKVPLIKSLMNDSNQSSNIPSQSIETLVDSININNSRKNNTETSLDISDTTNESIGDNHGCSKLDKNNESKPLDQCNCSKFDVLTQKIDNLGNLMNKMVVQINEMEKDFESFKLELKGDLIESLSEVISKQLNLDRNMKFRHHPSEQEMNEDVYEQVEAISYGREVFIDTNQNSNANQNTGQEFYGKSPKENVLIKTETVNDAWIPKKQNTNMRNFKKQIIHNVLDPLPENSPLVISSDKSLVMQKLAEKYLSETYYKEVVVNRGCKTNGNLEKTENDKHVNELSFASYDYLKKYNLIKKSDNNIAGRIHGGDNENRQNIMFFENLEKGPKFM